MRIGTSFRFTSASAAISDAQTKALRTQNELASGVKVSAPSDDPVNASQIVTTQASVSAQTSYQSNQSYLNGELNQLDTTLGSIGDSLTSVRETLVSAGNGALNDQDRKSLAATLTSQRSQLLTLANTRSAAGQFLFAGFQSGQIPFSQAGNVVAFSGDAGSRGVLVAVGQAIRSNADGQALFMTVPRGNGVFATAASAANTGSGMIDSGTVINPAALTRQGYAIRFTAANSFDVVNTTTNAVLSTNAYQPGNSVSFDGMRVTLSGAPAAGDTFTVTQGSTNSVFSSIDQAIAALQSPVVNDVDRSRLNDALRQSAADLEQAENTALAQRADVGGRLNALQQATQISSDTLLNNKALLSQLQDVDFADAATRLAQQQTGMQAAIAAYGQTSKISLFDYLR